MQSRISVLEPLVVFGLSFVTGIAAVVVTRRKIAKKLHNANLMADEKEKTNTGGNEL